MSKIEVNISPDDVIVDVYPKRDGRGMQVDNQSKGIQITHKATGIVVSCNKHRHMVKNKDEEFIMLVKELVR